MPWQPIRQALKLIRLPLQLLGAILYLLLAKQHFVDPVKTTSLRRLLVADRIGALPGAGHE